ncbi:MAG: pyridoxal-phosphate dependent enzyme [Armatimonadota bacterium]|nr:pyridoxal-phosphate dependent enzyme [Armatimonadota bacterium]
MGPQEEGTAGHVTGLQCLRCGTTFPPVEMPRGCPACADAPGASNVTPVYARGLQGDALRAMVARGPASLWRYRPMLPGDGPPVTLNEGWTPLVPLARLGAAWGLSRLAAKDETRNPTGSFKDRMCAIAFTRARAVGARVVALASSGNAGAAAAAYAARAGLRCVVLTTPDAPEALQRQMQALGALLIATPTSAERWTLLQACVEELGWYPLTNFLTPPVGSNAFGLEGYKTIAFELCEARGWRPPDWVVVPTCYGDGLWGIVKGFLEARERGLTDRVPRVAAAEVFGPLAAALATGAAAVAPVPAGPSVAVSIAAGTSTYQALHALHAVDGRAVVVDDAAILDAQAHLGEVEGIFVEPASAAALAAARTLRAEGALREDDDVVVILTATGLKDVRAVARTRPAVPVVAPRVDALLKALTERYGSDMVPSAR